QVQFFNTLTNSVSTYTVTSRIGVDARLHGAEVAAEVPLGAGFGIGANATYVDSKDQDGVEMLGTSKGTYNVRAFYEDDRFKASLAWNYRTDYSIAFVGNGTNTPGNGLHKYQGYGTLAASLGFNITKDLSLHLDGTNLLNPVRSTYFITENAPGYWHESGRQYYLSARMKF
ncbi:MAG TPA: TonB-dependent receptor, partial [Rubrivivax sp.]|nr:TonB-dependent receptor [Rubrivivax sp.]